MDHEDRVIFKWKTEVAEQKETANDMRQRNEALVYNVLPVHVAEHFMKNTKRSHDDLYSQSYAEVGVLFASMPNFSGKVLPTLVKLSNTKTELSIPFRFLLGGDGQ